MITLSRPHGGGATHLLSRGGIWPEAPVTLRRLTTQLRSAQPLQGGCPEAFDQREVARQVQAAFLPKNCPECTGVHVAARHQMSECIGGDLYDFVPGNNQQYSLVIGDVTGHELYSALVMSLVFGAVHTAVPKAASPADVVSLVNDLLCDLNDHTSQMLMCSLFVGTVDPQRHQMVYANAGHPAPIILHRDGRIEQLPTTCLLPGVDRETCRSVVSVDLRDVSRLFLYTDGLTEARDRQARFFGSERITSALSSARGMSVDAALGCLFSQVMKFADGRLEDDLTMVLADFFSNGNATIESKPRNAGVPAAGTKPCVGC